MHRLPHSLPCCIWIQGHNSHMECGYWEEEGVFRGHLRGVMSAAFSSDGSCVTLCVWNVAAGKLECLLESRRFVTCVPFSPDGHYPASGYANEAIRIWDTMTQEFNMSCQLPDRSRVIVLGRGRFEKLNPVV